MNLNQQQIHNGYDSDVTDAEWEIVGPLIDTLQSSAKGRPLQHDLRSILNAIFYLSKTGCQWRSLPKDFPHYTVVNYHYNKWRKDGTLETINAVLRQLARKKSPRRGGFGRNHRQPERQRYAGVRDRIRL